MANSFLTPSVILKDFLAEFENELVLARRVHRDYSEEFAKVGDTVTTRRPVRFLATSGATMSTQDIEEGSTTVSIDKQKHVAFSIDAKDLTLKIEEFRPRYIRPAVKELAQEVESDLAALYKDIYNWVGTPGSTIDSIAKFLKGPQRMDELAMVKDRTACLSPADYYGMLGSVTGLFIESKARTALERASLGRIANVETYALQSAATHITGTRATTGAAVNGASQSVTYEAAKATWQQSLVCDGFAASATVKAGDVFTINGVFAINPRTRTALPYLQQFVVKADATADGTGNATLTISPPIITSGPYQTVSAAPADNAALTFLGAANTGFVQNVMFCPDTFALVSRPLAFLPGLPDQAREEVNGISARMMPVPDGVNDRGRWRIDILYGVKTLNPGMGTRISG